MNLKKRYTIQGRGGGKKSLHAVDDVSFNIPKNKTLGMVGESGSGKSTIGKLILNLEKGDEGNIVWDGNSIMNLRERDFRSFRRKLQIVFQDPFSSLNPKWRVGDILSEGVKNFSIDQRKSYKDLLVHAVEEVGMSSECLQKFPHEFSGGQRQRIAIARSLIIEPEFLVCDEIVSALDFSVQGQIINLLRDIKKKRDLTLLFISHDLPLTAMISDVLLVLYHGKVLEEIPGGDLSQACHPYTLSLIENIPPFENKGLGMKYDIYREQVTSKEDFCRIKDSCPFKEELCGKRCPTLEGREGLAKGHKVACFCFDKVKRSKK